MTSTLELKANLKSLKTVMKRVEALQKGRLTRQVVQSAKKVVHRLAEEGRAGQTNPQGRKWTKKKDGSALRWHQQVKVVTKVRGGAITVQIRGPKWARPLHQGWRTIRLRGVPRWVKMRRQDVLEAVKAGADAARWKGPARRILPKGSIPKKWAEPVLHAMGVTWREFMAR